MEIVYHHNANRKVLRKADAGVPNSGGRRATIRDVAAQAGVSLKTVSFALNGKPGVDPATRAAVERAASLLGYSPSRHARLLRSQSTSTLALVLPEDSDNQILDFNYYLALAMDAASTALSFDCSLLLVPGGSDPAGIRRLDVDGVIICDPPENDWRIDIFAERAIPVVTVEADPGRPSHQWYVDGDNRWTTRTVCDHLVERGAQSIAFLATTARWGWMLESTAAYREWCSEHGHPPQIITADPPDIYASARDKLITAFTSASRPDAVFAPAERHSNAVLHAVRAAGLQIPHDVLVVSGSDCPETATSDPPVTAMDLAPAQRGSAAVRLLLDRIHHVSPPQLPVVIKPQLTIRASSSPSGR